LAEPFLTIGRLGDYVPGLFQYFPKEGTDLIVVVNDENRTMIHVDVMKDVAAASRAMEAPARPNGLDG